jgi:hypothetical protein
MTDHVSLLIISISHNHRWVQSGRKYADQPAQRSFIRPVGWPFGRPVACHRGVTDKFVAREKDCPLLRMSHAADPHPFSIPVDDVGECRR